jgi:hypothetical protein
VSWARCAGTRKTCDSIPAMTTNCSIASSMSSTSTPVYCSAASGCPARCIRRAMARSIKPLVSDEGVISVRAFRLESTPAVPRTLLLVVLVRQLADGLGRREPHVHGRRPPCPPHLQHQHRRHVRVPRLPGADRTRVRKHGAAVPLDALPRRDDRMPGRAPPRVSSAASARTGMRSAPSFRTVGLAAAVRRVPSARQACRRQPVRRAGRRAPPRSSRRSGLRRPG